MKCKFVLFLAAFLVAWFMCSSVAMAQGAGDLVFAERDAAIAMPPAPCFIGAMLPCFASGERKILLVTLREAAIVPESVHGFRSTASGVGWAARNLLNLKSQVFQDSIMLPWQTKLTPVPWLPYRPVALLKNKSHDLLGGAAHKELVWQLVVRA